MRNFSCSKEDLDKFTLTTRGLLKKQTMQSLIEEARATHLEVFKMYGLEMDETTLHWYAEVVRTEDPVALHYFIHHMLWQIVDAHDRGVVSVDEPVLNFFRKITSDCIDRKQYEM